MMDTVWRSVAAVPEKGSSRELERKMKIWLPVCSNQNICALGKGAIYLRNRR
jgi:hypothetical protein